MLFLFVSVAATSIYIVEGGLLRTPKVYNAVITTDDNLQPSRAYPYIQPVIHETPITYPFNSIHGYSPFGYDYSPYHTGYIPQQQSEIQSYPPPQQQQQQPLPPPGYNEQV